MTSLVLGFARQADRIAEEENVRSSGQALPDRRIRLLI